MSDKNRDKKEVGYLVEDLTMAGGRELIVAKGADGKVSEDKKPTDKREVRKPA